jgi:hypothetical protein
LFETLGNSKLVVLSLVELMVLVLS